MIKKKINFLLGVAIIGSTVLVSNYQVNAATAKQHIKESKKEFLKAHPEIEKELKAIKALPEEQKKQKMKELRKKYPEYFKNAQNNRNKGGKLRELAKKNPELAKELKALKGLPEDERRHKMRELRKKYLK